MEALLTLTMFAVVGVFIFFIYRFFKGRKFINTDELYSQHGVTVNYSAATITLKQKMFDVNKVTGIKTLYNPGGSKYAQHVMIELDDIARPVHKVMITGTQDSADKFTQRLSVALRKAGGRSFI